MNTHDMPRDTGPVAPTRGPNRRFDAWRLVTAMLALLLLGASLFLFAAADDVHREAEECARTDGWFCLDFSGPMRIAGVWVIVLTTCFAGATVAPLGAWRRRLVIVGVCLSVLSPIGLWLLLRSPIAFLMVAGLIVYVIALRRVDGQRAADGSVTAAGGQDDGA